MGFVCVEGDSGDIWFRHGLESVLVEDDEEEEEDNEIVEVVEV